MSNSEAMNELLILVTRLANAKKLEKTIKEARIAFEEQIAALIPTGETGQKTQLLSDGSRVTVKRALSYKADLNGIRGLFARLQEVSKDRVIFPPIKTSTTETLDVKGYEWFKEHDLYVFNKLVEHVTVTPKKVSIVIQEPKE